MKLRNLALCLLVPLLAGGLDAGTLKLGKRYRDESNGFQFYPPGKWDQVPTKFREVTVVAKFSGKPKKSQHATECQVLRFLKTAGARPEGERGKSPKPVSDTSEHNASPASTVHACGPMDVGAKRTVTTRDSFSWSEYAPPPETME